MPIVSKVYSSEHLTTFTVTGNITLEDIMQELEFFYKGEPTKNALWDFTNASLWNYTEQDIDVISSFAPRHEKGSSRNKTAIVAKDGFSIDFGKMIKEAGEADDLPFKIEVLPTAESAYRWLG